jgi:hypothetical protein
LLLALASTIVLVSESHRDLLKMLNDGYFIRH